MAITISGENNNDRILAQDGVIDQISGINIVGLITASHINVGSNIQLGNAGIVTATTFVGNLTGNVNSTSPLLLQTGGSERFRITGDNALGIAGANYGSSGQVLTSGGSGSAVSWATPAVTGFTNGSDNRVVTATSGSGLNGEANLTFDGSNLGINGDLVGSNNTTLYSTNGGSGVRAGLSLSGSDQSIKFYTVNGGSERLRIDSSGNVSIHSGAYGGGGAAPQLYVRGTGGRQVKIHNSNAGTSSLQITNATTGEGEDAGTQLFTQGSTGDFFIYNAFATGDVAFGTRPSGGSTTERLRITSAGRVGIDRTSPLTMLDIKVPPLNTATITTTNCLQLGMLLTAGGTGSNTEGHIYNGLAVGDGYAGLYGKDGGSSAATDLEFFTGTASAVAGRMRIQDDGKIIMGGNVSQSINRNVSIVAATGNSQDVQLGLHPTNSSGGYNPEVYIGATADGTYGAVMYFNTRDTSGNRAERVRITSGGDVLIADTSNSLYNDTSGGGMNLKANGQLVLSKQANSVADPLIWLNDTGQTTNRTILLAQDGSEKGHIGLNGNNLTLGVSGGHLVQIVPAYGASYPTSRGSVKLGGGNATNGFPLIGYNNSGTRIATHVCTGSFYNSTGMIIIKTTLPKHNTGYTMWSCRITGYAYSTNEGGAIDCVVGCYTGENNYYNPTVTGVYPNTWRDNISFATITTGDHNGHLCIRLGQTGTTQLCEIAVTDFVWGYSSVSDVMAEGWSMVCLTSDSGYNSQVVSAIQRSKEIYNDEFQVVGANSGELLTNRLGRGGTIMGTYQYTQYNQGQNYEHLIRSPLGHTDLTDQYCDSNWSALITASVDGTSTVDTGTTYFCQDNSDNNNSLQITNKFGYSGSSGSSNRIYMVINSGRVAWKMDHPGGYRVSVTVQFLAGGKKNATYNTADTAYQSN